MSTRGLIGFILNNEYKATYNHYDSYPEGLGQDLILVLNEIIAVNGLPQLREQVAQITWVEEDSKPSAAAIKYYQSIESVDCRVGTQTITDWYCLLRNTQGADALYMIQAETLHHLIDSSEFIKDSLFCEWSYLINFDSQTLEVYKGFQKQSDLNNRFGCKADEGYYPCKKIAEFSLKQKINLEQFLETLA